MGFVASQNLQTSVNTMVVVVEKDSVAELNVFCIKPTEIVGKTAKGGPWWTLYCQVVYQRSQTNESIAFEVKLFT